MAAPPPHAGPVGPDTLITVKVIYDGQNRRFKLALRDLGAHTLPQKLRVFLSIPLTANVKFDRFSDSAGAYVTLDSNNPAIYKQLYRAAKAKLKLRLRATLIKSNNSSTVAVNIMDDQPSKAEMGQISLLTSNPEPRSSYLDTVLARPPPKNSNAILAKNFVEASRPAKPVCPMPGAFYAGDVLMDPPPRPAPRSVQLSQPTLPSFHDFSNGTFSIDCNHCGKTIPGDHYHCSICEKGDFDLCQACVDSGVTCDGDTHWLIKRLVRNGGIVASTTETRAPRAQKVDEKVDEKIETPSAVEREENMRTCNSCISHEPAERTLNCRDCPDFDICIICFMSGQHGHNPAHRFQCAFTELHGTPSETLQALCSPGRGLVHQATCDGCNQQIVGVRHKCLSCPDFDYCPQCKSLSATSHPGHRFAALYEPLAYMHQRKEHHRGIYCDGPLCTKVTNPSSIRGDRYKCAVCDDTDFCANCEALPNNGHNKTHPLIKFRTPIRHVSIQTVNETEDGQETQTLGDRRQAKHAATETNQTMSTNAATQVQTPVEVKTEEKAEASETPEVKSEVNEELQAWYESDSTPDGSDFGPKRLVAQSWTLRNPGPSAWPAGCAVHFIGGDDMRNLDMNHPSSTSTMDIANKSNVLEQELEAGKTAVFTVLLRSPAREGRAISYWRLKTPGGLPFGHKLWVDINVKAMSVELPIRTLNPPAPVVTDASEEKSLESSAMIFPKLEKESPTSSVHNVAEQATPVVQPVKTDDGELVEDVESLDLEDDSEDDEAFLTDEEYDILDASDEDFLMEAQQAVAKK